MEQKNNIRRENLNLAASKLLSEYCTNKIFMRYLMLRAVCHVFPPKFGIFVYCFVERRMK